MYQLRRLNVGCDSRSSSSSAFEDETVLLLETTKIGRNPEAVDVVLTSTVHSNMISRIHSTIVAKQDKSRIVYILTDQSLNGTYINDYRAKGPTELKPGDIIKFGHVNGAAIRAGCHGPQHSAEFTFIFEKATTDRMERRRPITIVGAARNAGVETSALSSQMLNNDLRNIHHHGGAGTIAGGNISASSRLGPLPTSSVDFQSWQTAASAGANPAAASPFYNLQRLPSYYPALPQFNPAYLQFWQQNTAWQQPAAAVATAQQLQQQQQQVNQKQQQSLMSEPLMDSSSWMSATVSSDLGMQSSGAQASAAHFRAPTIQQSVPVPPSQQSLASASAVQNQQQQQQSVAQRFATNFATGMMPTGATNLLTSFAQRMCQQPANAASAAMAAAAGFPLSAAAAANQQFAVPGATTSAMPSSGVAAAAAATAIAPCNVTATPNTDANIINSSFQNNASSNNVSSNACSANSTTSPASSGNVDNVKRMECDSSVPSPPKTQQPQHTFIGQTSMAQSSNTAAAATPHSNASPHVLGSSASSVGSVTMPTGQAMPSGFHSRILVSQQVQAQQQLHQQQQQHQSSSPIASTPYSQQQHLKSNVITTATTTAMRRPPSQSAVSLPSTSTTFSTSHAADVLSSLSETGSIHHTNSNGKITSSTSIVASNSGVATSKSVNNASNNATSAPLPSSTSTAILLAQSKTSPFKAQQPMSNTSGPPSVSTNGIVEYHDGADCGTIVSPTLSSPSSSAMVAQNSPPTTAMKKESIDMVGVHLDRGPSSCGPHYSSQSPPPTLQASVTPKPAASPQAMKVGPSSASSANDSMRGRVPRSELTSKISSGDQSVSRSPSHHSPKRRGHGHSESSRSRSPTPVISDHEKRVSKKIRKSNEVARLLNDLTEGAWMRVARKSGRKNGRGANTSQTRRRGAKGDKSSSSEDEDDDDSENEDESSWSDGDQRESDNHKSTAVRKTKSSAIARIRTTSSGRKTKAKSASSHAPAEPSGGSAAAKRRRGRGRPPKRTKRTAAASRKAAAESSSVASASVKRSLPQKRSKPQYRSSSSSESSASSRDESSQMSRKSRSDDNHANRSRSVSKASDRGRSRSNSSAARSRSCSADGSESENERTTKRKQSAKEVKKSGAQTSASKSGAASTARCTNGLAATSRRSANSSTAGAVGTASCSQRGSATPSSQSASSTPKKRGRPPVRTPAIFAEVSSDSSLMSSDSSLSPRPRRRYVVPQRKVGMAPVSLSRVSGSSTAKTKRTSAAQQAKSKAASKKTSTKKTPAKKSPVSASAAKNKTPKSASTKAKGTAVKRRKKNSTSSESSSSSSANSQCEHGLSESEGVATAAANKNVGFDEWSYHDPEKRCDAKAKCKKPQGESVDWVQCDFCDLWYHVECVVGYSEVLDDGGEFDCGCTKKKNMRKRGRK